MVTLRGSQRWHYVRFWGVREKPTEAWRAVPCASFLYYFLLNSSREEPPFSFHLIYVPCFFSHRRKNWTKCCFDSGQKIFQALRDHFKFLLQFSGRIAFLLFRIYGHAPLFSRAASAVSGWSISKSQYLQVAGRLRKCVSLVY